MNKLLNYFEQRPILGYIIYFTLWYILLLSANWEFFDDKALAPAKYGKKIILMALGGFVFIQFLTPLLNQKKYALFLVGFYLLMTSISVGTNLIEEYILFELFPKEKEAFISKNGLVPIWKRALNPMGILVRVPMFYMFPTLLLYVGKYMREQQRIIRINEQKKIAELKALKGQLNPHFLFNTLNNIYSLTLLKNDQAPEVVSKLSDILDYMIYRCDSRFVPLKNEIKLLEDYIQLEKVRYGKRVSVTFEKNITNNTIQIAPLILLTFLENAFKHGVSEELNQAEININIQADTTKVIAEISNTIPSTPTKSNDNQVGLSNIHKQLELLYPNEHQLKITQNTNHYLVHLNLASK